MSHPHDIDPQGYQPCGECAGTGWIRCTGGCLGDGWIEQESWDYALNRPRWTRQVCPTCHGLGGWKCKICDGTGSIARERRFEADAPAELTSGVSRTYEPSLTELREDFYQAKREALAALKVLPSQHLEGEVAKAREAKARETTQSERRIQSADALNRRYSELNRQYSEFNRRTDKLLRRTDKLLSGESSDELVSFPLGGKPFVFSKSSPLVYLKIAEFCKLLTEEIRTLEFNAAGAEEKLRWLDGPLREFAMAFPDDSKGSDKLKNVDSAVTAMWYSVYQKERMQHI